MVQRTRGLQFGDCTGFAILDRNPEQFCWNVGREIDIAVGTDRDAVEADAVLGRSEGRIGRPDFELGAAGFQAVDIRCERVGDIGDAVTVDDDVVAQRGGLGEREAAFVGAGLEIESLEHRSLRIARAFHTEAREIVGADIERPAVLVGENAERGTAAIRTGLDEWLGLSARRNFHHAAFIEASGIERSVLG
jgi:hypothetical protein